MKIEMEPIGYVRNEVRDRKDVSWGEDVSSIILDEEYISGLKGLEDFSHVNIIYYLDKAKYEKEKHLQIFAIIARPSNSLERSSITGPIIMHGRHQVAQKTTSTS